MGRSPRFWVMVAFFVVVGPLLARWEPAVPEERRALLVEQFHLPDDVAFVGLKNHTNKGWASSIDGIVQFTPAQFAAYEAALDDPTVWKHTPFEYRGVRADAEPEPDALKWWPGSMAILTGEMALFWVNWGHIHGQPPDGGTDVWVKGPRRSFCFAVMGERYGNRVVPCNTLPANGSKTTRFAQGQRPELYVRGLLDLTERRLFMYVKSNVVRTSGCEG